MARARLTPPLRPIAMLALLACGGPTLPPGTVVIAVAAVVEGAGVASLEVEVGAPDITPTLRFPITVADGMASGTITVPSGSDRDITLRGRDASGAETHRGSVRIPLPDGAAPAVVVTLAALAGGVPIEVVLGTVTLGVSPASVGVVVGSTTSLTATIRGAAGAILAGRVRWTSGAPIVATVDTAGVVTAVAPGTAQVRASIGAARASATVTVTAASVPQPALRLIASGLSGALYVTAPPGDTSRIFVVQQSGRIRVIRHDSLLPTPFLDVASLITSSGERGLLGMAFHPRFGENGFFYVDYTDLSGDTRVVRYRASADPNVADPASATLILTQAQPFANHNGGLVAFGPDRMLYVGLGDGGSFSDPLGSGQNRGTLLGKLLRIDVDAGTPYAVPSSNPFVGVPGARGEIWAYGLRNPWRFSFDRLTGDLYIADVGQSEREEVNVQAGGSAGGQNYGWNVMEGMRCFSPPSGCNQSGLTLPVLDYTHADGCSITGGYVYRGTRVPSLAGHYLYSDWCTGFVRSFRWVNGQATDRRDWSDVLKPGTQVTSFGEDARGELYITTGGGNVYRIVPQGG